MEPTSESGEIERRAKRLDSLMEGVRKEAEANKNATQQKILWGVLAGLEIAASVLREAESALEEGNKREIEGNRNADVPDAMSADSMDVTGNAENTDGAKPKRGKAKPVAPPGSAAQDLARFRASRYAYLLEKERGPFRRRDPNLHVSRVVKHKGGKSK